LLSVSAEATSNLAFQSGPQRAERSHPSSANDLFDALVSHNTVPDTAAAPPPAPPTRRSDETPPPEAAGAANSPSPPPPSNDSTRGTDADTPGANASANRPADGGANQPQPAKTVRTKDDPAKTTDQQTSGDPLAVDPTILAQQATVPTPVPVAVAVSVNTTPTNVPAAAPSGGSTPPLAIAAAAIAATSQALSGQVTTPPQGKTDSNSGPTAAASPPTAATTPALSAPGIKTAASVASSAADASPVISQARQLGTSPANAATLTSAVAAAPVAPKTTSDKTSASSVTTDSPDDADPTATSAPGVVPQNSQQQQAAATGKADAANVAVTVATADAAAPSPSLSSAHEHGAVANAGHPLTETGDQPAQVLGALQVQPNSATAPATGGALSATTAANGPVPLSGLALEIAASIKSGKSRFEIRLDPADLGRIDVRIDIDRNGQVTSHLTVDKPETLSILRQDAPQLQRALDDAGVKTGSGGLQFSLRDQSSSGQNNGGDSRPNAQRLIIADEDTIPASVAGRSYGRSLGASGGVDIRV
jgi:flagellar hook-length control protein FliK